MGGGLGSGAEDRAEQTTPGGDWGPLGFTISSRTPTRCGGGGLRTHFQKKPTPFLHLGLGRAARGYLGRQVGHGAFLGTWAGVCGTG